MGVARCNSLLMFDASHLGFSRSTWVKNILSMLKFYQLRYGQSPKAPGFEILDKPMQIEKRSRKMKNSL